MCAKIATLINKINLQISKDPKRPYTQKMKIAIIGGGITGLTAAYELTRIGHSVVVLEKDPFFGGLAQGFTTSSWDWYLESAYHHLFTNDKAILSLLTDIGLKQSIVIKRPITATLWNNHMYPLDSASSLLQFPGLTFTNRVRTGFLIAGMKSFPFWQILEHYTAESIVKHIGGTQGWDVIWKPLMEGKFGKYSNTIAASWLWARIKKRTPSLAYIEGGFHTFVSTLEETIKKQGGILSPSTTVKEIKQIRHANKNPSFSITLDSKDTIVADTVVLTIPTPLAVNIVKDLPKTYVQKPLTIPHLHAQVLIIESKEPLLDSIYWLNITDPSFPFLAMVSHTNYMDKKHYGNNHITYIGNYLPSDHEFLTYTKEKLYKTFLPYIKKINPKIKNLKPLHLYLFTAPFAQPVHQINYSQKVPSIKTPIEGLFLANMDSIYPWDRGTNYAVELGQKVATMIKK